MNIIISSLNNISVIATDVKDFDSAKLFIAKSIPNQDKALFSLTKGEFTYPLKATKVNSLEKNEFYGYRLSAVTSLQNGEYTFSAAIDKDTLTTSLEIENNNDLIDEHDPVLIVGRRINPVTAEILSQDLGSQQITFYMRAKYDGVSFLGEGSGKKVYVDFIPVDKKLLTIDDKTFDFISMELTNITPIQAPNGSDEQWMALKWNLPYVITKDAGTVPFQITVAAMNDSQLLTYIWQTYQSSLTVSKNIGFRAGINVQPETEVVNTIIKRLDDLEEVVGYQSDDIADNDRVVILDCGWGGSSLLLVDEEDVR